MIEFTNEWLNLQMFLFIRHIFSGKNGASLYSGCSNGSSFQGDSSDTHIDGFFWIFGSRQRGQRSGGPYGRSKFQNENFSILNADSESLQKSMNVKCSSFFNIFSGTLSKFRLKVKIEGKFKNE